MLVVYVSDDWVGVIEAVSVVVAPQVGKVWSGPALIICCPSAFVIRVSDKKAAIEGIIAPLGIRRLRVNSNFFIGGWD